MQSAETIDRRGIREVQSRKLRRLLAEVLPANRFYARKLAAAGVDAAAIRGVEDLAELPFTSKDELQEDQRETPPYGSILTYPLERYVRLHQTSGTTGQPIRWLDTAASWDWLLDCWRTIYQAAGVCPEDRFFFPFSFGPFIGFWAAFDGALRLGNLCIPGGGLSSSARLAWIVEHGIHVITCTPTYALRLAEVAAQEGVDLPAAAVRLLIVAGEPGGNIPAVRQRIESAWGARCLDHWGMTEVGPLGFEPIERPGGIHLIETDCIAEVIDPATGRPLEDGGRGELVITTLERPGCPLLRYRTGDLVEIAAGRNREAEGGFDPRTGSPFLRLEGGILGRADQMVLVRGNNVYPGAIEAIVRRFPEVVEYRAEVIEAPTGNDLRLLIEIRDGVGLDPQRFAARVTRAVQDQLFFRPEVTVAPPGTLPRFELKARRFFRITSENPR